MRWDFIQYDASVYHWLSVGEKDVFKMNDIVDHDDDDHDDETEYWMNKYSLSGI